MYICIIIVLEFYNFMFIGVKALDMCRLAWSLKTENVYQVAHLYYSISTVLCVTLYTVQFTSGLFQAVCSENEFYVILVNKIKFLLLRPVEIKTIVAVLCQNACVN